MLNKEDLKRHNDSAEIRLIVELFIVPLSVLDVVHGDHGLVLLEGARAGTSQLLHVSTAAENISDVDTEGTDVGTSFARNPEDAHVTLLVVVEELGLVDGTDTELLLDGGDQRRSLEYGTSESQESLFDLFDLLNMLMKLDDSNVLFTSRLLSLNESGGIVNTGNEATCDLGI